jgi:hypothetical protein
MQRPFRLRKAYGATGRLGAATTLGKPITFHRSPFTLFPLRLCPVSVGTAALRISDPALLTEDLDYDPNTKRFFITTVRGKKIISADFSGTITEFAKSPDNWPLLAIKIDPNHGVLWVSEVALQGFVFVPEKDWGTSVVLCYDLKTGKPGARRSKHCNRQKKKRREFFTEDNEGNEGGFGRGNILCNCFPFESPLTLICVFCAFSRLSDQIRLTN